jgi:hypothetical protein
MCIEVVRSVYLRRRAHDFLRILVGESWEEAGGCLWVVVVAADAVLDVIRRPA